MDTWTDNINESVMAEYRPSFAQLILDSMRNHPPKSTAQVEVETGRELNYRQLAKQSLSVVQGLRGLLGSDGVEGHECTHYVIAIVSFNSEECHSLLLASLFISATTVPIDPSLTPEEMILLFDIIKPCLVYTEGGKTLRKVETALTLLGMSPLLVVSGRQKHPFITFQSLLLPTDPDFRPMINEEECEHVPFILFSSGTCGLPKGVKITDNYLVYNCTPNSGYSGNVVLVTSPIFWLSGIMTFFSSIIEGTKRVFLRGPTKATVIFETIQNYKVTTWFTSPTTLLSMISNRNHSAYNLTSLQLVVSSGSVLNAENQVRIQRELFRNKIHIYQAYGMTEIGTVAASFPGSNKLGSVGKVRPGIESKAVDPETGESLEPLQEGELCFKGEHFMKGYCEDSDPNGGHDDGEWFHTGDIGYIDHDGFIFIVDRLKDIIKYRNYQISPAELEGVLMSHPSVKDCAVFGVSHPLDGDYPVACVVLNNKPATHQQLIDYLAERVSENKHLRGGLKFVEHIPRTSTGKTRRNLLRSQFTIDLQGTST